MKPANASSQSAWALLTNGVTSARVRTHRLQQLVSRVLKMIEDSEEKEHLYEVAGDIIIALPEGLTAVASELDQTSYALSLLGQEFLKDRLPLADKKEIEDAVESVTMTPPKQDSPASSAKRVASRFLKGQE